MRNIIEPVPFITFLALVLLFAVIAKVFDLDPTIMIAGSALYTALQADWRAR